MAEPMFAHNAEMIMPDGSPFPDDANFQPGTKFFIKDGNGLWHEAKITDASKNNGTWHRLTGLTKSKFD